MQARLGRSLLVEAAFDLVLVGGYEIIHLSEHHLSSGSAVFREARAQLLEVLLGLL